MLTQKDLYRTIVQAFFESWCMMIYFKRFVIIACCTVFFVFSSFVVPHEKASAHPLALAVPAGITIGGGAYTLGALGLAGVLGIAGYDINSEAINQHAKDVWAGSTQLSKDSINLSIEAAYAAGNVLTNLDAGFNNWFDSIIASFSNDIYGLAGGTFTDTSNGLYDITTGASSASGVITGRFTTFTAPDAVFVVNGIKIKVVSGHISNSRATFSFGGTSLTKNFDTKIPAEEFAAIAAAAMTFGGLQAHVSSYFPDYTLTLDAPMVNTPDMPELYNHVTSKIRENWESMKDAGLVLPVNDAIPFAGGQRLTYNPATDTYAFPSGKLYDGSIDGAIDWSFPSPQVVRDKVTGKDVVAFPTRDVPIGGVGTGIGTGALTGTWTDVFTGDIVVSDSIPIELAPPVPPLAPDLSKPSKGLVFAPIVGATGDLTKKFPFSIPFDFLRQLGVFDVSPEAPVIKIDMPLTLANGVSFHPKFEIDFKMFDKVAAMSRWFTVIVFDIGLILAIRRLMPE